MVISGSAIARRPTELERGRIEAIVRSTIESDNHCAPERRIDGAAADPLLENDFLAHRASPSELPYKSRGPIELDDTGESGIRWNLSFSGIGLNARRTLAMIEVSSSRLRADSSEPLCCGTGEVFLVRLESDGSACIALQNVSWIE